MSRSFLTTEGIKLREHLFRESDVSFQIFTRDKGTIRAMAPGLKRSRRRFPGSIRKFCFYSLELSKGKRDFYLISNARFLEGYENISRDFRGYCSADYILQVISHFYPENMESSYIFDSLKLFLRQLEAEGSSWSANKWMEIRILNDSGFLSRLVLCSQCATPFDDNDKLYYNTKTGHAYCKNCRKAGKYEIFNNDMKNNINHALAAECGKFRISSRRDVDRFDRITTEVIVEKLGFFPKSLAEIFAKNRGSS